MYRFALLKIEQGHMMKIRKLLFAGVAVWAVAASLYAYRARDSAIRGWNHSIAMTAERDALRDQLAQASVERDKVQAALADLRALREADAVERDEVKKALAELSSQQEQLRRALADSTVEQERLRRELAELKVRSDAGLPFKGSLDPAKADAAVRGYIHRTNVVGTSKMITAQQVYDGLGTDAQLCGGMTWAHVWAMRQLGYKARYVTLGGQNFIDGKDRYQTHAVAEVYYRGDWHISDPTFDIHLDCSDGAEHISVKEAFACLDRGERLIPVEGESAQPEKSISSFRSDYSDYYAAYEYESDKPESRRGFPDDQWVDAALALYNIKR